MPNERALTTLSQTIELSTAVEQALALGDLAKLDAGMRVQYYNAVCLSVGLNPLTRPFDFIKDDNGRLQMYARKEAAEQLRKIHRVSCKETGREWMDNDTLAISVTASLPDGREEDEMGVVYLATKEGQPFTGQARANNIMKCLTKAKRRATLAICGLGFELADEGGRGQSMAFNPHTGEIHEDPVPALPESTILMPVGTVQDLYGEAPAAYIGQEEAREAATPEATEQRERAELLAKIKGARTDYGFTISQFMQWLEDSETVLDLAHAPIDLIRQVMWHLTRWQAQSLSHKLGEIEPDDDAPELPMEVPTIPDKVLEES